MSERRDLFSTEDERLFKRQFVIQFLASKEALDYQDNCHRGWPKNRKMAVEDAACLAEQAWKDWVEVIGVKG